MKRWQTNLLNCLLTGLLVVSVQAQATVQPLNLNTATAAQLATLPGLGPSLARRIVQHRQKHGAFKRPQDVIVIRGVSARRFRQFAPYLRTD